MELPVSNSVVTVTVLDAKIDESMNMKKKYLLLSVVLFFVVYFVGCSEVNKDVPTSVNESTRIHPVGFGDMSSSSFHGVDYKSMNAINWDVRQCKRCHGSDYSGGITGTSCVNCHGNFDSTSVACNTCHGDMSDPSRIAPPRALNGDTDSTSVGAGAHYAHLYRPNDLRTSAFISCTECHSVPGSVWQIGHIDSTAGAEIVFGELSKTTRDGVTPSPVYDKTTHTCTNTYCHGTFKNGNTSNAPVWNVASSGACGTCHGKGNGDPTPNDNTHAFLTTPEDCTIGCHTNVITATKVGTTYIFKFNDNSLHVNGSIDF
jgi:predicted CxxxxCH...CXXCH cytochrome family protein